MNPRHTISRLEFSNLFFNCAIETNIYYKFDLKRNVANIVYGDKSTTSKNTKFIESIPLRAYIKKNTVYHHLKKLKLIRTGFEVN